MTALGCLALLRAAALVREGEALGAVEWVVGRLL
jgi:hypothetical protein